MDPMHIIADFGKKRKAWYTYWAVIARPGHLRAHYLTDASRARFKRLLLVWANY